MRAATTALLVAACGPSTPTPTNAPARAQPELDLSDLLFAATGGAEADGDRLWFQVELAAANKGNQTLVLPEVVVLAPSGFTAPSLDEKADKRFAIAGNRGFALRGSLEPGEEIRGRATFAVPLVRGAGSLRWTLPVGAVQLDLIVAAPPGSEIDIRGATGKTQTANDRSYRRFKLDPVNAGEVVAMEVSGMPFIADPSCRALEPTTSNPSYPLIPADGRTPPMAREFSAPDYRGKQVSLRAHRGKVVVVHFWASWCAPCAEELPVLASLGRRLGPDVAILALSSDSDWDGIKRLAPTTGMTTLHDRPAAAAILGPIATDYGTRKVPETYLVDREGRLHYYFVNKRDWSRPEAEACIRTLF